MAESVRFLLLKIIILLNLNKIFCKNYKEIRNQTNRIIGGVNSAIESFPYLVSIWYDGSRMCGGSIINQRWILTAAQCTEGLKPQEIYIRVGSSYIDRGGAVHKIEKIVDHPLYNIDTLDYDYSLLKVSIRITYSNKIKNIELAKANDNSYIGAIFKIAGWGTTESGYTSEILKSVEVPYVDWKTCQAAYLGDLTKNMFCAGYMKLGGKDACQGDSGGPITANGIQYGITSWGEGCGLAGFPGVYASVVTQRDWIRKVSEELEDHNCKAQQV